MFIAVNSGNHPRAVKGYMEDVGVDWLTIADADRSFERQFRPFGVKKITLENDAPIMVYRVLRPDGTVVSLHSLDQLQGKMGSPEWYVQPDKVPDRLKKLWKAVEFGNVRRAAKLFYKLEQKQEVNSQLSQREQEFLDRLKDVVRDVADKRLRTAHSFKEQEKPWEAFKRYRLLLDFQPFERVLSEFSVVEDARSELRSLRSRKMVQTELRAEGILRKITKTLFSTNTPAQEKSSARRSLDKLVKQFPETEAAERARLFK